MDALGEIGPIEVRRHGSKGADVVVLHGGPGAHGSALGLARGLAAEFRVLEPLQRRSGAVPVTVARHVEDLAQAAPAPSAIVGHSWGAMLGLSFAARYPERVSRLALVGCGTYDEESRARFRTQLGFMDEKTRSRIAALKERLRAEADRSARDFLLKEIGTLTMAMESYELLPEDPERQEDQLDFDAGGNAETWQDALRLQRQGREPQSFASIACPVLMLHGAVDPHPGKMTRDRLRTFIPQLEYVEFDQCGHEPWRERHARAAFFDVLRNWLRAERPDKN